MDLDGRMHSLLRNVLGLMLTYTVTKTSSWLGVTKESRGTSNKKGFQNSSSRNLCTRNLDRITPSDSRDQGPLWKGSSSSVSRDIPHHFLEPDGSSSYSQQPSHWPLSSARWIQSMPSNSVSLPFILIPSSHLCLGLGLGSNLFPSGFLSKTLCARAAPFRNACHCL